MTTDLTAVQPWLVTTIGLGRRRHLAAALGAPVVHAAFGLGRRPIGVLGWGRKRGAAQARWLGQWLGLPFATVEDGPIRSVGLGVLGAEPFGFSIDHRGVAYDATAPSDLEELLRTSGPVDESAAAALMARMAASGICKYNDAWNVPSLPATGDRRVLVVDQTAGDRSIALGLATTATFAAMVAAARAEHPTAELLIRVHPDVIAGRRRGCIDLSALPTGCRVVSQTCNPHRLIELVEQVYVVSSQLGLEALVAGKPVTCFGAPAYAGWGLTDDRLTIPRRGIARTRGQVFTAIYRQHARYVDPLTGEPCGLERIIERIEDHARVARQAPSRIWCVGFRWWKRPVARAFLAPAAVGFVTRPRGLARIAAGDQVVGWGLGDHDPLLAAAVARSQSPAVRMEDGFVRSVGLGSDLVRPASLVVDRRGLYFDPRQPSDLEHLLQHHPFTDAERARGDALIERLRRSGVTKYNTGAARRLDLPPGARGRPVILVPGQVEDDASIRTGTVDLRTNGALLVAVRAARPEAFIIHKPHPDVLAGNRRGLIDPETLGRCADLVVIDCDMAACLRVVDEVHTLTSLTGFEGLIHGRLVSTYGIPFYAGWGLTRDRHPAPRRTRPLTLGELVWGSLVAYPRYRDPLAGLFTGPEAVIDRLEQARAAGTTAIGASWLRRQLRKLGQVMRHR